MNATEHVCIEKLCVDQEREKIGRNQIKLESMKWAIPFESHTPSVEDLEKHPTLGLVNSPISHSARHQRPARERH